MVAKAIMTGMFKVLMIAILIGLKWNQNTVLIYISFIVMDVDHFFICLLYFF
jgi:hypothetical protein